MAEKVAELAPGDLNAVYFANSGSVANDSAIRMLHHYNIRKGKPEKNKVLSRHGAYHGSTHLAMALTTPAYSEGWHCASELVHHIRAPHHWREGDGMTEAEFLDALAEDLTQSIEHLGAENICAFIAEPIQGAGGVIIPPKTYWPEIQRICKKYNVLLIADEVISGFGRLGEWFGSTVYDIEPDLIAVAKGITSGYLPMGGVLVHDRIAQTFELEGGEFFHGTTYAGHPACAAAALANLEIMEREGVVEHVHDVAAPKFAEIFAKLGEHPLVGQARTKGLLGALELVPDKPSRERFPDEGDVGTICRDISFEKGLVMRAVRDSMILSPPLVITNDELDWMADTVRAVLDETGAELKRRGLW